MFIRITSTRETTGTLMVKRKAEKVEKEGYCEGGTGEFQEGSALSVKIILSGFAVKAEQTLIEVIQWLKSIRYLNSCFI